MSRIPWSRYTGEDIEAVVAIMLCRQNPSATLVRPDRGDGGLDVIVPTATAGVYDVYQVKKFASNLTNTQKRQILKSLAAVHDTHQQGDVKVRNWYLTMPLDPTKANLTWLQEHSGDLPFTSEWRGLTFIDALAATYPDVVDYYLRDSRERLQTTVRDLNFLNNIERATEALVGLDDVKDALTTIQSLADTDPHFRYAIRLSPVEPPSGSDSTTDNGALFTATWRQPEIDTWFTIGVYPRFAEALNFRPVTMNAVFTVPNDSPYRVDFDQWRLHGRPFTAGPEIVQTSADFPLGLGWDTQAGTLKIGAQRVTDEQRIRVIVAPTEHGPRATLELNVHERGLSADAKGGWLSGSDDADVLRFELLFRQNETLQFSFTPGELTGKDPARALPTLRFVVDLHHATHMALAPTYGPQPKRLGPVGSLASDQPTPTAGCNGADIDGIDFGSDVNGAIDHQQVADFVEALTRLQNHIPTRMLVPDLDTITTSTAHDYTFYGRLLAGEVIQTKRPVTICATPELSIADDDRQAAATSQLNIDWEGTTYPLGTIYTYCPEVTATAVGSHDDHTDYRLIPTTNNTWLHATDPALLDVPRALLPVEWFAAV